MYWTSNNHEIFNLQTTFLRHSLFDLLTDDSHLNFQSVCKKSVHHETYKRFWDNFPPNLTKSFVFQNSKFTSPFSFICSVIWKLHIQLAGNSDLLTQYYSFQPKHISDRPLIFQQECPIFTVFSHIDPDCIATTIAQPYQHLSKIFDHPLNDKALKIYNTVAIQQNSYGELLFFHCSISRFSSKKQYRQKNQYKVPICLLCSSYLFCKNLWKYFLTWTY